MKLFLGYVVCCFTTIFLMAVSHAETRGEMWAQEFFSHNEETLTKIQELVAECTGRGALTIYPDARTIGSKVVDCPRKIEITKLFRAIGVLWINVSSNLPYGGQGPFKIAFVLSSEGLLVRGSGSAIYYFPNLEMNPFGDSISLKGLPGHWFYRRS